MWSSIDSDRYLPLDDQGPFADLDRIRIDMLNEEPPAAAETLFAAERVFGAPVLARLRFFHWVLHDLYGGGVGQWEASVARRDERLAAVRRTAAHTDGPPAAYGATHDRGTDRDHRGRRSRTGGM